MHPLPHPQIPQLIFSWISVESFVSPLSLLYVHFYDNGNVTTLPTSDLPRFSEILNTVLNQHSAPGIPSCGRVMIHRRPCH